MTVKNRPYDPEKRSEYRLEDEFTVYIEIAAAPQNEQEESRLVISKTADISANGIQVIFDYPLHQNSILMLCIETHQGSLFKLAGEVIRQEAAAGKTMIGFRLLDSDQTDIALWKNYIGTRLMEEE
jgi:hypothetical protein